MAGSNRRIGWPGWGVEKGREVVRQPPLRIRRSEEGYMCPACIASAAVVLAGAGSGGGILALCIGKFRRFFRATGLGLFQKVKEKCYGNQ